MNTLLYSARMALRDFLDINITTQGSDQVYISIAPDVWAADGGQTDQQREELAQAERQHNQTIIAAVVDKLRDMDMTLVDEEEATRALLEFEPAEVVRAQAPV